VELQGLNGLSLPLTLQQQHSLAEETARKTYRLSLFEQRFRIYEAFIAFGERQSQRGFIDPAHLEMVELRQKAQFVFPRDVIEWFEEIEQPEKLPHCGIIMPIAAMPNYEKSHWDRVRIILDEAIADAGYTPRLVSESEDIGVIHASIVQNLYDDAIVVCDVSAKNPNVMFELGMRLAFDKPTIVVKDDQTAYSFDTSPIEHISYRADLRFDDVRDFGKKVAAAIKASVAKKNAALNGISYAPILAPTLSIGCSRQLRVNGLPRCDDKPGNGTTKYGPYLRLLTQASMLHPRSSERA
jgi:hypothetical protein